MIDFGTLPLGAYSQVDITFVNTKERKNDCTNLTSQTLWIDLMPSDNCALADFSFCEGKTVTLTFDNADPIQYHRAKTIRQKLKELTNRPPVLIFNLPNSTIREDLTTGKVLRIPLT